MLDDTKKESDDMEDITKGDETKVDTALIEKDLVRYYFGE